MKDMKMQQGGMTAIGFIGVLLMIAFFTLIVLKLMPIYYENFKINSALKSLKDEEGISEKTNGEIQNIIMRRFRIDNIQRIALDDMEINRDRNGIAIDIDYEIRDPFFANVDVVVYFKDKIEIPAH